MNLGKVSCEVCLLISVSEERRAKSEVRVVKLHLGAHKTATTHLQRQLTKHVPSFSEGQYYIPLKVMRAGITGVIVNPEKTSEDIRNVLTSYRNFTTLVLSDENISGTATLLKNGKLYKSLEDRCIKIRNSFATDVKFEVYFSFRDYRDFIPSMYCEYLRYNDFCIFEEYLKSSNYKNIDWVTNYDTLASVFGQDSILFFNFDRFSLYERFMMEKLLPKGCSYQKFEIESSPRTMRASFSNLAIQLMSCSEQYLNRYGMQQLVSALDKPGFDMTWLDNSKFRPLVNDKYLEDKYLGGLDQLRQRGCYV